jgi:hypothetical protein
MNLEKLFHIHKYGDNWMNEYQKTVDLRQFRQDMEKSFDYPGSRPDVLIVSTRELDAYKKAVKNGHL